MIDNLLAFHFLRPMYLILIPFIVLVALAIRKQAYQGKQSDSIIANHLKQALTPKQSVNNKLKPIDLTLFLGVILCLAVAGPAWRPQAQNDANQAPIAVILKLSQSMLANDIAPMRLTRAKQKISDLLSLRTSNKHALIVYASSPHRVLPLTEDSTVFTPFIEALSPKIMPNNTINSDSLAKAVLLANQEVGELGGSIVVLTDDINRAQISALNKHAIPFLWWQFATEKGGVISDDKGNLLTDYSGQPLLNKLDTSISTQLNNVTTQAVTISNQDLLNIAQFANQNYTAHQHAKATQYQDMAWYFVWPLVFLMLTWFRKGWTSVAYTKHHAKLNNLSLLLIAGSTVLFSQQTLAKPLDWFLTSDQQAAIAYHNLQYDKAAAQFADANWRAKSLYENGNYIEAADVYGTLGTPDGFYNRATALLKGKQYALAIKAFEQVLKLEPNRIAAQHNLAIAKQVYRLVISQSGKQDLEQNSTLDVDDNRLAEDTTGEFLDYQVTSDLDTNAKEQWMRSVSSDMADFLANKFMNDLNKEQK